MKPNGKAPNNLFHSPGVYRIRVKGVIDPEWSDWLGGMKILGILDETGATTTELIGEVPDQAALAGLLNTLYDMHLSLLLVQYINDDR